MTPYKPTKEDKELTEEILFYSKNMRDEEFIEKMSQMICDYRIKTFQKGFRNEPIDGDYKTFSTTRNTTRVE